MHQHETEKTHTSTPVAPTCFRYPQCRGGSFTHEPDCAALDWCPIPGTLQRLQDRGHTHGEPHVWSQWDHR